MTAKWSEAGWSGGFLFSKDRPDLALACGRRRERFRERSIYNRLADLEWDMPIGEIKGSHGDILVRAEAFRQVGGFDTGVLVSEDYELCVRLRKRGWILLRIDGEMTLHDMAMTRFGQWWWRSVRSGYGYADGLMLHGGPPSGTVSATSAASCAWGSPCRLVILILAWPTGASLCSSGLLSALVLADFAVCSPTVGGQRRCAALYLLVHPGQVSHGHRPGRFTGSGRSPADPSESLNTKGPKKPIWIASRVPAFPLSD